MAQSFDEITKDLATAATQITHAGLMRGWSGQLSARCVSSDGYSVAIKRSGSSAMNAAAYCQVTAAGKKCDVSDPNPSMVAKVHCAFYELCPEVHAVVQCRGLYADAVASVLGEIPLSLETFWALKAVPVVLDVDKLRGADLSEFINNMEKAIRVELSRSKGKVAPVCVPFFGLWITGANVADAVERALTLEDLAKSAYLRISLAQGIGKACPEFPAWFGEMLQKTPRPASSTGVKA